MSDLYTELIVKKKATTMDVAKKGGLIGLTVLAGLATLFIHPLAFVVLVGLGIADYLLLPRFDLEFEYLYVNGELDVDKIMSKTKRKRVYSVDMEKLEMLAPVNSHALDHYNQNPSIKTRDYSSQEADHQIYAMIVQGDKGLEKVLFEPNEVIMNDIKRIAPRKVNLI